MQFLYKALIVFTVIIFIVNPPQTLAEEGETLFYDNFNENLSDWTIESGNWYISNGYLVGSKSGRSFEGTIKAGDSKWDNYRLELDVNGFQGIDQSIGFRYTQTGNYGINLRYGNGTGYYSTPQIKFWKNTTNYSGVPLQTQSVPLVNNKWYHIKVELLNENIKVWVDNTLIFDFTDPGTTVKKGPILLNYSTGAVGIANMWFDNVKVTALPEPFLDLPWDYESKGLSFNEAAMAINSFFDHQYPLLSRGLDLAEPANVNSTIVDYLGRATNSPYTKHDGYDYGNKAKAKLGDSVLAAASGSAAYINSCSSCGNMIVIDHGNGYQTRYMHLLEDGLITDVPNQSVPVNNRQQIGKAGFSGNVQPRNEKGAHIHFGVFQDKNGDGNFTDNEPDGVTDPYGWQSTSSDPWENYTFNYTGQARNGNKSYYLWKNKLASMIANVTSVGNTINTGNYTLTFPQNSTTQPLVVNAQSAPVVQLSNNLISVGSTLSVNATDALGNIITKLPNSFTLNLDFSSLDLSKIKVDTLSFYSSPDGANWTKENTSFPTQTLAQAQIDHLSYFALIGERKDITAPETTAIFSGTNGQPSWFRSDVQLTLDAQDNEDGLGVDYTLYRINEDKMQIYKTPLNFSDEGHYKVEFYSADQDDNIENVKSIEFNIDKTPPELSLETSTQTLWPPNGKMANIQILGNASDDNEVTTSVQTIDEYGLIQPQISDFGQTIQLEAKRKGNDLDGRTYTIEATAKDKAGNTAVKQIQILVPHDQGRN